LTGKGTYFLSFYSIYSSFLDLRERNKGEAAKEKHTLIQPCDKNIEPQEVKK